MGNSLPCRHSSHLQVSKAKVPEKSCCCLLLPLHGALSHAITSHISAGHLEPFSSKGPGICQRQGCCAISQRERGLVKVCPVEAIKSVPWLFWLTLFKSHWAWKGKGHILYSPQIYHLPVSSFVLFLWGRASLCIPGSNTGTWCVGQAGLELGDPPDSASWKQELKVCTTIPCTPVTS